MNRLEFLSQTKFTLFFIAFPRQLNFQNSGKTEHEIRIEEQSPLFPDKDNYLSSATCVFATPDWGDGKNPDDSFVDVILDIECYDNLYSARGAFRDNSEIEHNVVRDMPINFSAQDSKKIFYDGLNNVNILILGSKRNKDEMTNDQWNVRWELVLAFMKGNVLSTGGSDPAIEYHFDVPQRQINVPNVYPGVRTSFKKEQFLKARQMHPGDHIG